eukprot:GHRR01010428.1.p1 GENE.GHRR01010428.1~~GHRR01010428.1.p1  ORF type:complete len:233 (+),score=67.02 GHRR01010428.1:248-946(+)
MEDDCADAWTDFQRQRDWAPEITGPADYLLRKVVQAICPSRDQWESRNAAISRVRNVLAGMPDFQPDRCSSQLAGMECLAEVHVFGSFCSAMYHKGSDLDLTLMGRWRDRHGHPLDMHQLSPTDTAAMLYRIKHALVNRRVAAADPLNPPTVINARVPVLTYTDGVLGLHVDITLCNHNGAFKSRFIWELAQFDKRFEIVFRLVKLWAEGAGLNDPKNGTLNSWSLTQMVST